MEITSEAFVRQWLLDHPAILDDIVKLHLAAQKASRRTSFVDDLKKTAGLDG